jgi:hypothetical protein
MIPPFSSPQLPTTAFVDRNGVLTPAVGFYLIKTLWSRTGLGTGVPAQIANNLTAAGTTQATALALTLDINEVTTVPAGMGVALFNLQPGQSQWVYNGDAANALKVYPAAGWTIDALALNAAYSLAHGKTQIFTAYSTTQIRSFQIG